VWQSQGGYHRDDGTSAHAEAEPRARRLKNGAEIIDLFR
jgi:hypothetical protein